VPGYGGFLLTGGETRDCPVAERVNTPKRMLGDKAYGSAELRDDLDRRGTKPVIPNRCNWETAVQLQQASIQAALAHRERLQNRLKDFTRASPHVMTGRSDYLASVCLAAALGKVDLMNPDPIMRETPHVRMLFNR
jgi:Transposase DDE domain